MIPTDTKSPFSSLTINASLIGLLVSILSFFGITIAPDVLPQLDTIIAGVASLVAIYGRFRANTIIV